VIPRDARAALEDLLGDRVRFDAPMARHTSLRVGGPADALVAPEDRAELARVLALCAAHRVPHAVVGGGFNTLVLDGGVEGVVIQLTRFRRLEERPGWRVLAEAGVSHARLTRFCIDRGLSGLEFGAGIPGTIGGWTAMNAGVRRREVRDAAVELEVMTPTGSGLRRIGRDSLRFAYRALRGLAPRSVIVSTLFAVSPSTPARIKSEVDRHLAHRSETQPLDVPSCGSVFKNPPGGFAGRLIEAAGLKGFRVGGAEISTVHANFIVNRGGATAADVLALVERAQAEVRARESILLEPEGRVLGRKS
jgi:UDP-N-acetylmuramate dehydrogenase